MHGDAFTHGDNFTPRNFAHKMPLQTEVLLQRRHLHEELLHMDVFTQTYFYMISDGGHQFCAKEFSKQVRNLNFTTALDDLDAFCAKGFASASKV